MQMGVNKRKNTGNIKLTCGYPGADWNALLVFKDCKDTDKVLHPRLQLMDGGSCVVSWHSELHVQAPTAGGDVGDEILVDEVLVLPLQIDSFIRHVGHSQLSWRRHWEWERGKKSQTEVIRSSQGSGDNDLPSFTFSQERFLRLISHAGNGEGMSHKLAAEERNARLMETTDISRSHGPISALTLAHNLWLTVFQLLLSWLQHKTAIAGSRGIQMFNSTASST